MPAEQDDRVGPSDVAAFLRANPRWLAANPDLYRAMAPPIRVHGDTLTDHMAAMLRAERAHAAAMASQADHVLSTRRAGAGLRDRVDRAVLALLRSPDPLDTILGEWPSILGIDGITLCTEGWSPDNRARLIPLGTVARLLAGRPVLFRDKPTDTALLHAEASGLVTHDALVAIPDGRLAVSPPALLALFTRDPHVLPREQSSVTLGFLGQAAGAALGR